MKSTGMVRKIDELGRFVLPAEIRQTMGIETRDALEIFIENDRIILQKYRPACIICGGADDVRSFKGKRICADCAKGIKEEI